MEHPGTLLKSERVEIVLHAVAAAVTEVHAAILIKVRLFMFAIYISSAKCVNYNNPNIAAALLNIGINATSNYDAKKSAAIKNAARLKCSKT